MTIESSNKTRPQDILRGICFSLNAYKTIKSITLECDFSDNVISAITNNLFNLQKLSLRQATDKSFSEKYFKHLFKNLMKLKEISIQLCLNDTIISQDVESCEQNEAVDISNLRELRRVTFDGFKNCPEIDLKNLAKLPLLESICYTNVINKKVRSIVI